MCQDNNYQMKQIYLQEDSKYTEHSNASCTFSKIYLSDNLLKHHKDEDEILAIVLHELCHDKRKHLIQSALADVCYMVLYGVGLAAMVQYGQGIIYSFGFTYQSDFILLYVFHSIWVEIPDFILRLGINWNLRRHEYEADKYAVDNNYGQALKKGLVIMFIKNEDNK